MRYRAERAEIIKDATGNTLDIKRAGSTPACDFSAEGMNAMNYSVKILSEHLRRESEELFYFNQAHRAHSDSVRDCRCEVVIAPHREAVADIEAAIARLTEE